MLKKKPESGKNACAPNSEYKNGKSEKSVSDLRATKICENGRETKKGKYDCMAHNWNHLRHLSSDASYFLPKSRVAVPYGSILPPLNN